MKSSSLLSTLVFCLTVSTPYVHAAPGKLTLPLSKENVELTMLTAQIGKAPQNASLYLDRSIAHALRGDYASATKDARRADSLAGEKSPALFKAAIEKLKTRAAKASPGAGWAVAVQLLLGDFYFHSGQKDEALVAFNRALELDPQSAQALSGLGFIYLGMGRYEEAVTQFDKSIALMPKLARAYRGRGYARANLKQVGPGLQDANKSIQLDPLSANNYMGRGVLYAAQDNIAAALADYNRSIALEPLDAGTYQLRSDVYKALNRNGSALDDLTLALYIEPHNASFYFGRAEIYNQGTEQLKALADYNRAIELDPQNSAYYSSRASAYEKQSIVDKTMGDKALADYNEAVKLAPQDQTALFFRAAFLMSRNELEAAKADLNKAVELQPESPDSYWGRATIFTRTKDDARARADYEKGLALAAKNPAYKDSASIENAKNWLRFLDVKAELAKTPDSEAKAKAHLYAQFAELHLAVNYPMLALDHYNAAIKLDPKNARYYYGRSQVSGYLRNEQGVEVDNNEALRLDPTLVEARLRHLSSLTHENEAWAECQRILKLDPNNLVALSRRAEIYSDRGQSAKAIEDYTRAIHLDPATLPNYYGRAMAYLDTGQLAKAEADLYKIPVQERNAYLFDRDLALVVAYKGVASQPKAAQSYLHRIELFMENTSDFHILMVTPTQQRLMESDFSKAISLSPRTAETYVMRARFYGLTSGSDTKSEKASQLKAIADYTQALKLDPTDATSFNARGDLYFKVKQYERAIEASISAFKLDPGYLTNAHRRGFYESESENKAAVAHFTQAIKRHPRQARLYFYRAILQANGVEDAKALADINQAIRLDSKFAVAYLLRGTLTGADTPNLTPSQSRQITADARAAYSKAIQLSPQLAPAYYQRAVMGGENAIADYSAFIRLSPRAAGEAYVTRARLYSLKGEHSKAVADYLAASRLVPPIGTEFQSEWKPMLQSDLADAYVKNRQYDRAIPIYTELLKAPPFGAYDGFYRRRGEAYLLKGDTKRAIADFDAALRYTPSYPPLYQLRAIAYRKAGQVERAGSDDALAHLLMVVKVR